MPTTPPNLSTPPADTPIRGQRSTFSDRLDAFITWLVAAIPQLIALALNVYNNAVEAFNSAASANTAKLGAEAAQNAAAATANATKWVTGTDYAEGVCTWSPTDYKTYRRKAPGGVSNTDPANDSAGWALVLSSSGISTANIETLSANKVLTSSSPKMQVLTAPGFGYLVKLPAANTLTIADPSHVIVNDGDYPIGVTNGADELFGQILPGDKIIFALASVSTVAGTWRADGNLDPWFQTGEAGATISSSGTNCFKLNENASLWLYQNASSYPCVRYVSHPVDGSLTIGNEYVLRTTPTSSSLPLCLNLSGNRAAIHAGSVYWAVVDYSAGPALSVGTAVGTDCTSTNMKAAVQDSRYIIVMATETSVGRLEAQVLDCGASGTTIAKGAQANATGYGTSGAHFPLQHVVDATVTGAWAAFSNGAYYYHALRSVTRSGTGLTWNAEAGMPSSANTSNTTFWTTAYPITGATYLVPYWTGSTFRYSVVTFGTACSWGTPVTSGLSFNAATLSIAQTAAASFVAAGNQSNPGKIEALSITSGTTVNLSAVQTIDANGATGNYSLIAVSTFDGKGLVSYTNTSSRNAYAGFVTGGHGTASPTVTVGATKWQNSAEGSSSNLPLQASGVGFYATHGASATNRFIGVSQHNSGNDYASTYASLTIDGTGNPSLGQFTKPIPGSANSPAAISGNRSALAGQVQADRYHGVYVGGKFKFGRGTFNSANSISANHKIQSDANALFVLAGDHRFDRSATIQRFRFAEVYA